MFVIVKQESFATVSVGILKLLLPVLLLAFRGRGIKHSKWIFYFFLGGMFRTFFLLLLWVFCFRVERFLRWLCVASAVPLKLAKNVFLTDASSYLPRTVVGFKPRGGGGSPPTRPPETYAPCPLALCYDRAQTHEREVITNGRQGQGSYLSQTGFFPQLYTDVCTSTWQITTILN